MVGRVTPWCALGLLCVLGGPSTANAQATGQLWANLIFEWLASDRLTYELDLEPKAQLVVHDDQPTWIDVSTTPHIQYALAPWIDVLGELDIGLKKQSDEVNTVTVTPRIGAQLHILSRILSQRRARRGADRENQPKRRLVVSTLLRLENQKTVYSTDAPSTSSWLLRDRFELAYPLNRVKTTIDGAVYLKQDTELFVPVDQKVTGGIVSQVRVRAGIGYRRSFAWRFEALYIWIGKRNEDTGVLSAQNHVVDLRVRRVF